MRDKFIFRGYLSAMIADYKFYADNERAIDAWLWDRDCKRQGMVIQFCDEETKMLFMMRWI